MTERKSPALLAQFFARVPNVAMVLGLEVEALMTVLVAKGLLTEDEWDAALAERIEVALSQMPEEARIVTPG